MMMTELIERELSNVWNKYVSNDVGVWDRMYALDYRGKLESTEQRARHYVVGGILSELAGPRPSILDVGCGCGTTYRFLERARVVYHGIDLSPTAIEQARAAFPGASFQVADFARYAPASRFDAVIFNEVLYYLPVAEIESTWRKARAMLADRDSLLVVSMSDNPKAKVLWGHCRSWGESKHDIAIHSRGHSNRWRVRAFSRGA